MEERLRKWKLILGVETNIGDGDELEGNEKKMDDVLKALYESDKIGALGSSSPNINRWLGDIRNYFPQSVVRIMQKDAIDLLGLEQLLLEPEILDNIVPDVHLVASILQLNKLLPDKTKDSARIIVSKLVKELELKLENPIKNAVNGALSRSERNIRPKLNEIDWSRTIKANLKNYQKDLDKIIPNKFIGYGRKGNALKKVILLVDQSGSMASSLVYAGIIGSILASIRSLSTKLIVFDTHVVDLTSELKDPIDLLFGTQLGGGTDIEKAIQYVHQELQDPEDTIIFLISDLEEGGSKDRLYKAVKRLLLKGSQFVSLLSLNNEGIPEFDHEVAAAFSSMKIPVFACTPDIFPDLLGTLIKKADLNEWVYRQGIKKY